MNPAPADEGPEKPTGSLAAFMECASHAKRLLEAHTPPEKVALMMTGVKAIDTWGKTLVYEIDEWRKGKGQ